MFDPANRKTSLRLLGLAIFLFCLIDAFPQQVTDNQIKTGYIYNFLKYIQWENEEKTDTFKIAVYGEDYALINTLKSMEHLQVKGKAIKVITFKSIGDIVFSHILLITNDRNFFVKDILDLIKGRNTLLITDRCEYPRYVMVNFTVSDNSKIQFEINSPNMEEARLKTSPKLVLLGGSEIDVRKLYLETEKSLITEKGKVSSYEKELTQKKDEIQNMNAKLHKLYKDIETLRGKIANQKYDLTNLTNQSEEQQKNLYAKSIILDNQKKEIEKRERQLAERDSKIHLKQQKIESYSLVLNSQKTEIEKRQATIEKQRSTLNKQSKILNSQIERIRTQAKFLYLLLALVLMASALIFVIYRNFVINKKRNQAILDKNKEIQRQSEELFEQTEQLLILNKELEVKKNIVEDALNKLKNTQTKLVESEKMIILGQLTAGIAHEINNPINFINSGIEGVKMAFEQLLDLLNKYEEITADNVNGKLQAISIYKQEIDYSNLLMDINQLTQDIKSGIYRTVEIIKGLRTFSRLDESDLKFTDLHKNVDSTLIILRNKFDAKIKIVKDYGDIPEIECYPGKINQVLLNLLINAVQAIKGKGQILIKTKLIQKENQPFVEILVKDSGMGMTDDVKKRIFEPFFTTKEAGEGTGLGLSITYNIIEIHHGFIEVDSTPGQGSAFTILLPVTFDKKNTVTTYTEFK